MIIKKFDFIEYTPVSNTIIQDNSMSLKARGLLIYLLSLPAHWDVIQDHLYKDVSDKDGRTAIDSALKEIKKAGYTTVKPVRSKEDGKLIGNHRFVSNNKDFIAVIDENSYVEKCLKSTFYLPETETQVSCSPENQQLEIKEKKKINNISKSHSSDQKTNIGSPDQKSIDEKIDSEKSKVWHENGFEFKASSWFTQFVVENDYLPARKRSKAQLEKMTLDGCEILDKLMRIDKHSENDIKLVMNWFAETHNEESFGYDKPTSAFWFDSKGGAKFHTLNTLRKKTRNSDRTKFETMLANAKKYYNK